MPECKPVERKYRYKHLTLDVLQKVEKDFKAAKKRDDEARLSTGDSRPFEVWKMIDKYDGMMYSEIFGLEFLPRHGTAKQGRAIQIHLNDYLVADQKEVFLISEDKFKRYFQEIKLEDSVC